MESYTGSRYLEGRKTSLVSKEMRRDIQEALDQEFEFGVRTRYGEVIVTLYYHPRLWTITKQKSPEAMSVEKTVEDIFRSYNRYNSDEYAESPRTDHYLKVVFYHEADMARLRGEDECGLT